MPIISFVVEEKFGKTSKSLKKNMKLIVAARTGDSRKSFPATGSPSYSNLGTRVNRMIQSAAAVTNGSSILDQTVW